MDNQADITLGDDPYMVSMYNGLERALAIMEEREPYMREYVRKSPVSVLKGLFKRGDGLSGE